MVQLFKLCYNMSGKSVDHISCLDITQQSIKHIGQSIKRVNKSSCKVDYTDLMTYLYESIKVTYINQKQVMKILLKTSSQSQTQYFYIHSKTLHTALNQPNQLFTIVISFGCYKILNRNYSEYKCNLIQSKVNFKWRSKLHDIV